jgi:hypothetical protein
MFQVTLWNLPMDPEGGSGWSEKLTSGEAGPEHSLSSESSHYPQPAWEPEHWQGLTSRVPKSLGEQDEEGEWGRNAEGQDSM